MFPATLMAPKAPPPALPKGAAAAAAPAPGAARSAATAAAWLHKATATQWVDAAEEADEVDDGAEQGDEEEVVLGEGVMKEGVHGGEDKSEWASALGDGDGEEEVG